MPATYEPIQTTTVESATTIIEFTSIAASWTDLRIVLVAQDGGGNAIGLRFNSDTGSNYSRTTLNGNGSTASSGRSTSTSLIGIGTSSPTDPIWGLYTVDVFSYGGSTYKTVLAAYSEDKNGSGDVGRVVGLWRSTSAVTSIILRNAGNFSVGSTATLYGIKASA